MFVPLRHEPGHAQVDFGEALMVLGGEKQRSIFSRSTCWKAMPPWYKLGRPAAWLMVRQSAGGWCEIRPPCCHLSPTPYEACEERAARVSSVPLVRYRGNDYSVPTAYGHREEVVRGYVYDVLISCGAEEIALI